MTEYHDPIAQPMPPERTEFRLEGLRLEKRGRQLHIWGKLEPLDRENAMMLHCDFHHDDTDGFLFNIVGPDDESRADAMIVLHMDEPGNVSVGGPSSEAT